MNSLKVGEVSEFKELIPRYVKVNDDRLVFVYLYRGKFFAYADMCPHQGGPACEGDVRARVIGSVDTKSGMYLESVSKDEYNIVCPWHGVEYNIEDGRCRTNSKLGLRKYTISVQGKDVLLEW